MKKNLYCVRYTSNKTIRAIYTNEKVIFNMKWGKVIDCYNILEHSQKRDIQQLADKINLALCVASL